MQARAHREHSRRAGKLAPNEKIGGGLVGSSPTHAKRSLGSRRLNMGDFSLHSAEVFKFPEREQELIDRAHKAGTRVLETLHGDLRTQYGICTETSAATYWIWFGFDGSRRCAINCQTVKQDSPEWLKSRAAASLHRLANEVQERVWELYDGGSLSPSNDWWELKGVVDRAER